MLAGRLLRTALALLRTHGGIAARRVLALLRTDGGIAARRSKGAANNPDPISLHGSFPTVARKQPNTFTAWISLVYTTSRGCGLLPCSGVEGASTKRAL